MKTTLFSKLAAITIFLSLFLLPSMKSEAQVAMPYFVRNNLPCNVIIKYEVYRQDALGFCKPVCFASSAPIPPGMTIPLNWPGYPACGCGIQIWVVDVNGVPVIPPVNAASPGMPVGFPPSSANGADPSGCSPSGQIQLDVFAAVASINP